MNKGNQHRKERCRAAILYSRGDISPTSAYQYIISKYILMGGMKDEIVSRYPEIRQKIMASEHEILNALVMTSNLRVSEIASKNSLSYREMVGVIEGRQAIPECIRAWSSYIIRKPHGGKRRAF